MGLVQTFVSIPIVNGNWAPVLDDARLDDLRHRQDHRPSRLALGRRRIDVAESAVRRAQVDAHYVS